MVNDAIYQFYEWFFLLRQENKIEEFKMFIYDDIETFRNYCKLENLRTDIMVSVDCSNHTSFWNSTISKFYSIFLTPNPRGFAIGLINSQTESRFSIRLLQSPFQEKSHHLEIDLKDNGKKKAL